MRTAEVSAGLRVCLERNVQVCYVKCWSEPQAPVFPQPAGQAVFPSGPRRKRLWDGPIFILPCPHGKARCGNTAGDLIHKPTEGVKHDEEEVFVPIPCPGHGIGPDRLRQQRRFQFRRQQRRRQFRQRFLLRRTRGGRQRIQPAEHHRRPRRRPPPKTPAS